MSCRGLKSLAGSHQRCARALNLASSAGSTLSMSLSTGGGKVWFAELANARPSSGSRQPVLPGMRDRGKLVRIERDEPLVEENAFAADPDVGDLIAARDVHQVRDRIVAGRMLERTKVHRDGIGLL